MKPSSNPSCDSIPPNNRDEVLTPITDPSRDYFDFSSDHFNESDQSSPGYPALFDDSVDSLAAFAMPTFQPINDVASAQTTAKPQTVSPKDVFLETMPAPPSSAMTNLSTPGTHYMDSPYGIHSTDTSPMFGDESLDDDADTWSSLFPSEQPHGGDMFTPDAVHQSMEPMSPPMSRNQSSPGMSSRLHNRHSSISGVNARKRDKPLPPITVDDPTDVVAVKRARNTAAARKSRAKKMEKVEDMEKTIMHLEIEVEKWKAIAMARNLGQV